MTIVSPLVGVVKSRVKRCLYPTLYEKFSRFVDVENEN